MIRKPNKNRGTIHILHNQMWRNWECMKYLLEENIRLKNENKTLRSKLGV